MIRSGFKILLGLTSRQCVDRFSSSALYVSNDKAREIYSVVVPYLDCEQRFKDLHTLEENLQKRGLNVNVNEIKELWEFYKQWAKSKEILETKRLQVTVEMRKATKLKESETKEKEMKRLELQSKLLKEDLKDVNKTVWGIEEVVILQALGLPNDLHPNTPSEEVVMQESKQETEITEGKDHLIVGNDLNCVDYRNAVTCYLKNDAAQFELAVGSFFQDQFTSEMFIPFSNPDFAKSVLIEGASLLPLNPHDALLLKATDQGLHNTLHLAGGASLFSFCAFHAKRNVTSDSLPARYITVGRHYNPKPNNNLGGLYSIWQSHSAEVFIALHNDNIKMKSEFDKTLELLYQIYNTLGLNFRIVNQPAKLLQPWESLRSSIQVYSYTNETFIEVGHLSIIDDFISKRLRMGYLDKKKDKFLKLVSGTVVNIPVLLALCLERSNDRLFFPEVVNKFKIL